MAGMGYARIVTVFNSDAGSAMGEYRLTAALFLRFLALIYFFAFVSIGVQIRGLAGEQGILPFSAVLERYEAMSGIERYWNIPTLFWINASDTALVGAAILGCIFAVLLFFNFLPRIALIAQLLLYLSLVHAGQLFMNFQWDALLLEAGLLAIFLSPGSRYTVWLFRWLLFRFRFLSGLSKLVSLDPSWANLTAVVYYFEVQPLPNWIAWYVNQLPDWLLAIGAGFTLFVEIVVPFMMFLPRPYRFVAGWLTIFLQIVILLTSNHNWFNLLTISLCLFLFDDQALRRIMPVRAESWLMKKPLPIGKEGRFYPVGMGMLGGLIVVVSMAQIASLVTGQKVGGPIGEVVNQVEAFRVVNRYHVFPTMKTERIELAISGSEDGYHWREYKFKYKPGDLDKYPEFVIPHQPRLDWQMWFVTIDPYFLPWFDNFLQALLENSPTVTDLLADNPFPDRAPRYLRVDVYRYHFTDWQTRARTGQWWTREYLGPFRPLPYLARSPLASNGGHGHR